MFNFFALPFFTAALTSGNTSTIQTIAQAITSIVTEAVSWITSFAGAIVSTPLLLFFVVLGVVGMGVGFIMRIRRM